MRGRFFLSGTAVFLLFVCGVTCAAGADDAAGDMREGIKALHLLQTDKAVTLFFKATEAKQLSPADQARAEMYLGVTFIAQGNRERAWKAFARAALADPACEPDKDLMSPWALSLFEDARRKAPLWADVIKAVAAIDGGKPDEGIAACTKALQEADFPLYIKAVVYDMRSKANHAKGEYARALDDASRAIMLNPAHPDFYNDRGLAFVSLKNETAALADFNRALALNPRYENAYINRGNIFWYRGDVGRALADYEAALKINTASPEALIGRGNILKKKGDFAGAVKDYTRAVELRPGNALYYDNRGVAHLDSGKIEAALKDFDAAIKCDPSHASAYFNRSIARERLGRIGDAIADMRQYVSLRPDDQNGRKRLEELQNLRR